MVEYIFCKRSDKVILAGFRINKFGKKQRYWCQKCSRRFVPNNGFWKMKSSPEVIAEAISCKKRGMSYNEVSKHFKEYKKKKNLIWLEKKKKKKKKKNFLFYRKKKI